MTSRLAFRRTVVALAAAGAFLLLPPPARADDGGGEEGPGDSVEKQVREQMQKIIRLMRENEQALLEATRGAAAKPGPVDVKPPDVPPTSAMSEATPSMADPGMADAGMGGDAAPTPRERGEKVRRSIDELLEGVRKGGKQIPLELEELIRMIPTQSGGGQGQPDPNAEKQPMPRSDKRDVGDRKPEDGEKSEAPKEGDKKPTDPAKKPEDRGGEKPPEGEKADPAKSEIPPWDPSLPEEFRRAMTPADIEKVPADYRALVERYQKWLQDHTHGGSSGSR